MIPETTLAFDGGTHAELDRHLLPGDGQEAAALLICTRTPGPRRRLLVRHVINVPYALCKRTPVSITWPGEYIEKAIDLAEALNATVILIHSHPGGLFDFSDVDDQSDRDVLPSLFHAFGSEHGSAIMIPGGAVRARLYDDRLRPRDIDLVTVAGDDVSFWWRDKATLTGAGARPMAFTSDMTAEFARLTAVVVGVSGTGCFIGEGFGRLGFGCVYAIEYDHMEKKNLNRIINSSLKDATTERLKVDVYAEAVARYRGEGVVIPIALSINTREAVLAASQADVIVCAVDSLEARHIADRIAAAFLMPLFDLGVVIPVRKTNGGVAIADVCGRLDYVQPGGATLADRDVYTAETLRGEYLRKTAPDAHAQELRDGYLQGVVEEAPSVITLNMRAASACLNELVARFYPFRLDSNRLYARTSFSLAACEEEYTAEDGFTATKNPLLARGDAEPLLQLPDLRAPR